MNFYFYIGLTCFKMLFLYAQNNSPYNPSKFTGPNSSIIYLFDDIKNKTEEKTNKGQIKGSPYFDKTFKLAQIEYFGKILEEKMFLRYNAFNDEMEISKNPISNSSEKILIKDINVSCFFENQIFRYLCYDRSYQNSKFGYLKELVKGELFSFFQRKTKVFMEAYKARTSIERSFPARFVEKKKYYFSFKEGPLIEVELSKRKFISKLKSYNSSVKFLVEKNNLKLKSLDEFILLFEYLNVPK